ncbi:MAG: nucleoside deaminase [Verrucomicrobia bacterium]|nr:MAG: nucleoside deaminase [Verrucomicrobiota bacterium]
MKNIAMTVSLAFLLLTLGACVGTGSWDRKPSSDSEGFPLNHHQILKHLRTANETGKEAVKSGHPPFGAVLVAPDGETVLMKQGNVSLMDHAETVIARQAFVKYAPDYLWTCTLVTTAEPCAMCAGNVYWANIGNVVYGVEEITVKELTGADKKNPTMNLPCRTVFTAGQKPIRVVGPVPELKDELLAPHRAYWK